MEADKVLDCLLNRISQRYFYLQPIKNAQQFFESKYSWKSVVLHQKGTQVSHFTALVHSEGKYYKVNDNWKNEITKDEAQKILKTYATSSNDTLSVALDLWSSEQPPWIKVIET